MEEKNVIKIKVSTLIITLAIIVIIIMCCVIYELINNNKIANNKVEELNSQVATLEGIVNNIEGTINKSETNSNNNTQANTNVSKTFSDNEIKAALQNYLDLSGLAEGSPRGLLEKLGFTNLDSDSEQTSDYYVKANAKYSEFKNKMLNYMTEQCFEEKFSKMYKNIDGDLYFFAAGATGLEFEVESITKQGDNSYIAKVYDIHEDNTRDQFNMEFSIENYNGKCVISHVK